MDITETIQRLLGEDADTPFGHQAGCARALLEPEDGRRRNVILTAPTGAGKTIGAIAPFVHARRVGAPFADRLIYALPLRSLASSLAASTREMLERADLDGLNLRVTLQTGEQPDDPFFAKGDIIFTTIDQLLSGYLNIPLSLADRMGNIAAGALVGAYVVFDEVHLMETDRSLATAVQLVRQLSGVSRFLLMSATLTPQAIGALGDLCYARHVEPSLEDLARVPHGFDGEPRVATRRLVYTGVALDPEAIIKAHDRRTLVVCNTVRRAQQVWRELQPRCREKGIRLLLLHGRFLEEDRAEIERQLASLFGSERSPHAPSAILVATQVVEAGLDLSCEHLHTELCAANSLLQRAGRCARFREENGVVHVYELSPKPNDSEALDYGPYKDDADLVDGTRDLLVQQFGDKSVVTFRDAKAFAEAVHGAADEREGARLQGRDEDHRTAVAEAMERGGKRQARDLIRDITSVGVFVSADPEHGGYGLHRRPRLVSIDRGTLLGALKRMADERPDIAWLAAYATPLAPGDGEQPAGDIGWGRVGPADGNFQVAAFSPYMTALNPAIARYSREAGLELEVPDPDGGGARFFEPNAGGSSGRVRYSYRFEPYGEHVARTLAAVQASAPRYRAADSGIEQIPGLPPGSVARLCALAAVLHDTGKLAEAWQRAIRAWQRYKTPDRALDDVFIAHSDFDPETDREAQRAAEFRRPPHAIEGAYAVELVVRAACTEWFGEQLAPAAICIVLTAIARHHGPRTRQLDGFALSARAVEEVRGLLRQRLGLADASALRSFDPDLARLDAAPWVDRALLSPLWAAKTGLWNSVLPLYWLVVRRLRLADQAATGEHERG